MRKAAKASSVGANTVKGPSPFSASTSFAAVTAATSVLNTPSGRGSHASTSHISLGRLERDASACVRRYQAFALWPPYLRRLSH